MGKVVAVFLALALGCARNVPQDKATGTDGRPTNAQVLTLENGEAWAKGIVTYPGGDRVDWKRVDLPKDKPGALSVRLRWTPPRPGLGLGLDVFDQYGRQVASSRGAGRSSSRARARSGHGWRRSRSADIPEARGTYFIRVYAPYRGDAGTYTLKVEYVEPPTVASIDPSSIPDPPKLPAVPPPTQRCDPYNWDRTIDDCKNVCPIPPNMALQQCQNVCPTPADVNIAACWGSMACPSPPDKRVKSCAGQVPTCAAGQPINNNCLPPGPPPPVRGRVVNINEIAPQRIEIQIDRGKNHKVDKGWHGRLLQKNGRPLPQSDFTVSRVGDRNAFGVLTGLTTDQVSNNKTVELTAP